MVTVRLKPEVKKMLEDLADRTGLSKTHHARRAILNYLEDIEDAEIGEKALAEFYAGDQETIPLSEVLKRLDLADQLELKKDFKP